MARLKNYFTYVFKYPADCINDDGIDLSGKVFYVGKGTNANRLDDHIREASNGCECRKCGEIRWIWGKGKAPDRQIMLNTLIESEAFEDEKRMIQEVYNAEPLTNIRLVLREAASNMEDFDIEEQREIEPEPEPKTYEEVLIPLKGYPYPKAFNVPFPLEMYEQKAFHTPPSWVHPDYQNETPYMIMPAKVEYRGETYYNTKAACNFTGVGRLGTRFIVLGEEFGLSMFIGHNVTYYRKSDLVKFLDWVNKKYPGESDNPNFIEPEAPYGKVKNAYGAYDR